MDPGTIVVGVDFSPCSRHALEAAARLARDWDARIVLVHAKDKLPLPAMAAAQYEDAPIHLHEEHELDQAVTLSTEWAQVLRDQDIETQTISSDLSPAKAILAAAKEHKAAVVVIGTHGRGGVAGFLLGSVAKEVVHKSTVPVLVVPQGRK